MSVADISVQASTLMIPLSTDGTETQRLLPISSALYVMTGHQPDTCRQALASVTVAPQQEQTG